jgi:hypothetical protein
MIPPNWASGKRLEVVETYNGEPGSVSSFPGLHSGHGIAGASHGQA